MSFTSIELTIHLIISILKLHQRFYHSLVITKFSRQGYNPPTDQLIQATLSIASNSADVIIIFRDTDKPVIQEYLANQDNKEYLGKISKMKELQINNEKITTANLKKLLNEPDTEQYIINCQEWSNRHNKAYDE